ncbi:MAG: GSCFA domain-containing protein [Hyphomicrobiales bacterium]
MKQNNNYFRTIVEIPEYKSKISYQKGTFLIGSCFVENIGDKLQYLFFPTVINPFGILYNPVSIERCINRILSKAYFSESNLDFYNERYLSFDAHSIHSSPTATETLNSLNHSIDQAYEFLNSCGQVIITLGTSWVYKHKQKDTYVANCHKYPAKDFERIKLSIPEIVESIQRIVDNIRSVNKGCDICFTLSPIRHWKDGAIENNLSKASLLTAIHSCINNNTNTSYFPSYEIMMDDLRDYRFYAEDMLHPNSIAIEYIWNAFSDKKISPESHPIMKEIDKLNRAANHRPFNPTSLSHQKFLKKNYEKCLELEKKYDFINITMLKDTLKA